MFIIQIVNTNEKGVNQSLIKWLSELQTESLLFEWFTSGTYRLSPIFLLVTKNTFSHKTRVLPMPCLHAQYKALQPNPIKDLHTILYQCLIHGLQPCTYEIKYIIPHPLLGFKTGSPRPRLDVRKLKYKTAWLWYPLNRSGFYHLNTGLVLYSGFICTFCNVF